MLNHSFIHIPSVGAVTERKIWNHGIKTLDDFIENAPDFFSANKKSQLADFIMLSKEHLNNHNSVFFYENLPPNQQWRIFKDFQDKIAYLDIETTCMDFADGIITTIALYDGKTIKHYVNGLNLEDFKNDIYQYDVIITYNGKTFDIPYIESYFGIRLTHPHLDLRYILRSLGYKGGLKSCERQLGIGRTGSLAGMDGFVAVLLWHDYQNTGNQKYLETLLSYNTEDVLSLEYLMISAYNTKLMELPFLLNKIDIPVSPQNPFQIDASIIDKIQRKYFRLGGSSIC
jgi:uncharacterized protein YprB with RNaseH-like and TPR domain